MKSVNDHSTDESEVKPSDEFLILTNPIEMVIMELKCQCVKFCSQSFNEVTPKSRQSQKGGIIRNVVQTIKL